MDTSIIEKLNELIQQGEKLVPDGGLEFSGYNAKMQGHYLLWRKNCLEIIGKLGDAGISLRAKITNDENGSYFYQNSAQNILHVTGEALKTAESQIASAPKTAEPVPPKQTAAVPPAEKAAEQKKTAAAEPPAHHAQQPHPPIPSSGGPKSIVVVAAEKNPMLPQLLSFLKEIGIQAHPLHRAEVMTDSFIHELEKDPSVRGAFFVPSATDTPQSLYELGILVGKLGAGKVLCIHPKDVPFTASVPGVVVKEFVVKLEEISFSIIKDLKAAGYTVTI